MSEQRPPLTQSLSLSEPSSTSTFPRPPKRRYTSVQESDFFTQSASTFYPRPYTHVDRERGDKSFIARSARAIDNLGLNTRGTDPDPTDPRTFIIHPPFTIFPGSERYPEGLTYQLLADNPEWFLDALDFVSTTADSSTATPYPPSLEPPRGWCPAKKKDLKNRGADGWPEGEEPRLRCTFCRRTYAGVNARSMWRRHVYEKHKIAMSNRRDGGDKPRGRGSNSRSLLNSYGRPSLTTLQKKIVAAVRRGYLTSTSLQQTKRNHKVPRTSLRFAPRGLLGTVVAVPVPNPNSAPLRRPRCLKIHSCPLTITGPHRGSHNLCCPLSVLRPAPHRLN